MSHFNGFLQSLALFLPGLYPQLQSYALEVLGCDYLVLMSEGSSKLSYPPDLSFIQFPLLHCFLAYIHQFLELNIFGFEMLDDLAD